MDSFVDKLAQRFNAGEMIKANGEAEAMEANRLKAQAEAYDKMIQEMRRLNLKTVELSEQISQMVQCSIEQIEAFDGAAKAQNEATQKENDAVSAAIEAGNKKQQEILEANAAKEQAILQESIQSGMENQQETLRRLEERLTTLRAAIEESLADMESSLRNGAKDYEPMMQALHAGISQNKSIYEENANQIKEMIVKVRLLLDENQKQTLDFVHKENVKVYRNVQAVVNDQTALHTREISDRVEQVEKKAGRPGFLLILTFLLAAGSVTIQVLQILGIL